MNKSSFFRPIVSICVLLNACSPSNNEEGTESKSANLEKSSASTRCSKTYGPQTFNFSPLGDGSTDDSFNIAIEDSAGHAIFKVIKKTSGGTVVALNRALCAQTVRIKLVGDALEVVCQDGTPSLPSPQTIAFNGKFDMKITPSCPILPDPNEGSAAIVGGLDARDAVLGEAKTVNAYTLGISTQMVRMNQPSVNGDLKMSKSSASTYYSLTNKKYCDTGVKRWGTNFNYVCP